MSGTDATKCAVCGGEFSATRTIIDGVAMHPRCAIMSHGSHTHEDMARAVNLIWDLRTALQKVVALDDVAIARSALENLFQDDQERDRIFIDKYRAGVSG